MIREAFTYLLERPKLQEAIKFGHLFESVSILSREKRCKNAWASHRENCKSFIAGSIQSAHHLESVLVLGSGPLHEIPIELLAKTFKRVVLVDIVHLSSTKKKCAPYNNIEFVEHELTEIERDIFLSGKLINKIPKNFIDSSWGLVLSVNVMSQLPLHLEKFIRKKFNFNDSEIEIFLQNITKNHFLFLESFQAPAVLITDTETHYLDDKSAILQVDLNYEHIKLPKPVKEWMWDVAPIPEFKKDIAIKMKVSGFVLKKLK